MRESGSQKVFVPFSRRVLGLLRSWLPPSQARVTFQGHRWRRGRQGGVKAGPGAQPTATQVWKRRRVRGQDLRGAKAMELGRTPSLDTMQGERDSYQILLQVKLAFPPSPQIWEERKLWFRYYWSSGLLVTCMVPTAQRAFSPWAPLRQRHLSSFFFFFPFLREKVDFPQAWKLWHHLFFSPLNVSGRPGAVAHPSFFLLMWLEVVKTYTKAIVSSTGHPRIFHYVIPRNTRLCPGRGTV